MNRRLILLIAFTVVFTVGAWIIFVTIPTQAVKRTYEGVRTLGDDIRKAFNFTPEIKVDNTVVIQQQSGVFELATLSQNFQHRYVWSNVWLGSTKRINITGTFTAKAGFDLDERFTIELRDDRAFVTLAPPRILSVESHGDIEYRDEQGIWNWVSTEDRNRATNAFINDARRFAQQAAFVEDAKREMERRLREVLEFHVDEVVINYVTPVPDRRR